VIEGATPTPDNNNRDQNEGPESGSTNNQPIHPSLELSAEQTARLQGSLALILSAPLNLEDQASRDHVAGLLEKALVIENIDALPKKPFHPESLIADAVISDLQEHGWTRHGSFEPTMDVLVSPTGKQKMQFEIGGTPVSSRPEAGTFFYIAQGEGAQEIWDERHDQKAEQLTRGQAEISEMISQLAASLPAVLGNTPWHQIDEKQLQQYCQQHPREVMLLAWKFKRDFADKLMLG
jgi:hypothetical protein